MPRLSLTNPLTDISLDQFASLAEEFMAACEGTFGSSCQLKISLMNHPLMDSCFIEDEDTARFMEEYNRLHTTLQTGSLTVITEEAWNNAAMATVLVRPSGHDTSYEMGHMTLKGTKPKTVSYYLQCGQSDAAALEKISGNHPLMRKGDGFGSHIR